VYPEDRGRFQNDEWGLTMASLVAELNGDDAEPASAEPAVCPF